MAHPLGVQPWGNFLLSGTASRRDAGLGNFARLADELVLQVLGKLGALDLSCLCQTSRAFYCFANHEELWRAMVFEEFEGQFLYRDSWRRTYITMKWPQARIPQGPPLRVEGIFSDLLYQPWLCATVPLRPSWLQVDNLERRSGLSLIEFRTEYERLNRPVVLTDVVERWPAVQKWTVPYLQKAFKGKNIVAGNYEMPFDNYVQYMRGNRDEMPLYLFDKHFVQKAPELADDFQVPEVFSEDLFGVMGEKRPDWRWLILGPARSGSSFHKDPNNTSAWNAVLWGSKKWILFPPNVPPPGVHPSPDGADVATPVSIMEWMLNFYKQCRKAEVRPLEGTLRAGECLFVPRGWWHLALNLEETLAITQNFVSSVNLPHVLQYLKKGGSGCVSGCPHDRRDRLYTDFVEALQRERPEVLREAEEEEQKRKAKKGSLASLFDKDLNRGLRAEGATAAALGMGSSAADGEGPGSNGNTHQRGFVFGFKPLAEPEQSNGSKKRKTLQHRETLKSQRTEFSFGFSHGMGDAARLKQKRGK